MLTDDLRSRLSQLNRGLPLSAASPSAASLSAASLSAASPAVSPHNPATPEVSTDDGLNDDLSQLPPGRELVNAWGKHWLRERRLSDLWPHGEQWLSRELVRLDHAVESAGPRAVELQAFLVHLPGQVMLLDLETCGFAGSPIFLVGLLHEQDQTWTLTQLLARNYAEEKALLQTLWTLAAGKRVLVTFNGKSFDWPMVQDRSTLHHLGADPRGPAGPGAASPSAAGALQRYDPRPVLIHCDLLHHARRKWGKQLPDCRLQTLERHICRRRREEDIPGHEIPAAYHDFVRCGDAWLMRSVLHHNALDLITLLQLAIQATQ